ncbi:MAG: excinuclease ABC subunit B [Pseudomonadota bacterium]
MRAWCLAAALALPLPAQAWEATLGPICVLTHRTADAAIELTYDPARPLYTLSITLSDTPWPDAAVFAMEFGPQRPNRISTTRHALSDDGFTLNVADAGFGNVLNGLQFNSAAVAVSGDRRVGLPLAGAANPVAAFRDCPQGPSV